MKDEWRKTKMTSINPYLIFNGNCKEAFDFYKSVFGREFASISQFKDMPPQEGMEISDEDKEKIIHVSLPIGRESVLMGSDTPKQAVESKFGDNVSISIQTDSEDGATEVFNKLSEGGNVKMPLSKTYWNAYFGMCVDKFGIHWMVNYTYPKK